MSNKMNSESVPRKKETTSNNNDELQTETDLQSRNNDLQNNDSK